MNKIGTRAAKTGITKSLFVVTAIAAVLALGACAGSSGGANVTGKVINVIALDGNTVRIFVRWTNNGTAPGSASCIFNTTVHNQFGDEVNVEVNSTNTNGNLAPGASQKLYQDIGVNNGDAQYVTPGDVSIVDC